MARKKLKEAEDESDLNSGTDKYESRKKLRKIRAAKRIDESTSSVEELSDDSFMSEIPNMPTVCTKKRSMTVHNAKKLNIATDVQKGYSKKTIEIPIMD